jgi:tRNA (adenine37-N6)-methyltransferase
MDVIKENKVAVLSSLVSFTACGYFWYSWRAQRAKAILLEDAYWSERRGRTRVEQEMRRLANVQLNTEQGFFVQPIGVVESCYRQCVGTPRQGLLVPLSRASVQLTKNMNGEAMDGLEEFSHVWLTFKFHLNTNSLKEARAFDGVVSDISSRPSNDPFGRRKYTFSAKITPPMLKEKKGVLATRSPHRPNPFGVTLARIEKVDIKARRLYVSACDLVSGTPILDIKPFVPIYDTAGVDCRIPKWIMETVHTRNEVKVASGIENKVDHIAKKLKQYKNEPKEFLAAIVETLEADVRSKFQTRKGVDGAKKAIPVDVPFDDATVYYLWHDLRSMEIVDVILTPKSETKGNYTSSTAERAETDALVVTSCE